MNIFFQKKKLMLLQPEIQGEVDLGQGYNNNTDRTPDVFFSKFRDFSFTITLRQKPKGLRKGSFELKDRDIACE